MKGAAGLAGNGTHCTDLTISVQFPEPTVERENLEPVPETLASTVTCDYAPFISPSLPFCHIYTDTY